MQAPTMKTLSKRKKVKIPKKIVGYGYSGLWSDGTLGWFTSRFPSTSRKYADSPPRAEDSPTTAGKRFFKCRITVEPLKGKDGRPITRFVKKVK